MPAHRLSEPSGPEHAAEDGAARLRMSRERVVREATATADGIRGYRAWRGAGGDDPVARQFRYTFETLTGVDALGTEAGADVVRHAVSDALTREAKDPARLPRGEQLRRAIIAAALDSEPPAVAPEIARVLDGLRSVKTPDGAVHVLELLTSAGVDFGTKAAWFERQLLPRLAFLDGRDRDDARQRMEEATRQLEESQQGGAPLPPDLDVPPPSEDSIQPTMDAMEKDGEGRGYFTVSPFFGGYFEEQAFDSWDPVALRWVRSTPRATQPLEPVVLRPKRERTECGIVVPGRRMDLPLPTGWGVAGTADLPSGVTLEEDANGHVVINASAATAPALLALTVGPRSVARPVIAPPEKGPGPFSVPLFGSDAEAFLADLARDRSLTPVDRAHRCKAFVKRTLKYSSDPTMNAVYLGGDPAGYFQRIGEQQKADCDVGNTYCAGLLMRLGIPHELVKGHYVKTKDPKGAASLGSGTRHAWLRVWDPGIRDWQKCDATPPGDPNMDDEEMDEREPDDSAFEGDFGEQEADLLTDDELTERLREAERKERAQQQSPEEQANLAFATEAGCTPEEARMARAAIERARNLKDKQGHRIRDRLIAQFSRIVRDNLKEITRYRQPVRISEGEELEDPVDLAVDLAAGEPEPTGFGVEEQKEVREQIYDGLDLILVCDKSGSMEWTDASTGKPRHEAQQEVVFLAADALLGVLGDALRRHRARLIAPLGVRVGVVSFHTKGSTDATPVITVELPLTDVWGPKEQYALWSKLRRDIVGGTPDHLGMNAAGRVIGSEAKPNTAIPSRRTGGVRHSVSDTGGHRSGERIRVVIEYSDGESDNPAAFQKSVAALRKQGMVVGTYRKDLTGFPDFIGEQVIAAVQHLHPKRVRRG